MNFIDDIFATTPAGTTSIGAGGNVCSNPLEGKLDGLPRNDKRRDPITGFEGTTYDCALDRLSRNMSLEGLKY